MNRNEDLDEEEYKKALDQDNDKGNIYAYNVKYEVIHIAQAASGRRGYYCLGCKNEMQACISQLNNRISFFRHDWTYVENQLRCTYSDETYRHKLAKEILQRIQEIKVPTLYKYPTGKEGGLARLIVGATIIRAHHVEIELSFFEDDQGNVRWGPGHDEGGKNLLIRPDVTFFNEAGQPILLIEIVATHKVDDTKKIKLKRLGYDAIQVIIPKSSPELIEKVFYTTQNTKWIYNYEQESTTYFRASQADPTGISSFDENQRQLFDETLSCRSMQIRELIRGIKRCLASQQFRDATGEIKSTISGVESHTAEHQRRLEQLQTSHRAKATSKYSGTENNLRSQHETVTEARRGIKKQQKELEGRYFAKKEQLTNAIGEQQAARELLEKQAERVEQQLEESSRSLEERINRGKSELGDHNADIHCRVEQVRGTFETLPGTFDYDRAELEGRYRDKEEGIFQSTTELGSEEARISDEFEADRKELEARFADLRAAALQSIEERYRTGNTELSRRITELLKARDLLLNFNEIVEHNQRHQEAWACFNSGAYKTWLE